MLIGLTRNRRRPPFRIRHIHDQLYYNDGSFPQNWWYQCPQFGWNLVPYELVPVPKTPPVTPSLTRNPNIQGWSCPYGDSGSRSVHKVGFFSLIQGQLCPQKLFFFAFREVGFFPHYLWTICHWARFVPKTSLHGHLLALFFFSTRLQDKAEILWLIGLLVYCFIETGQT